MFWGGIYHMGKTMQNKTDPVSRHTYLKFVPKIYK